MLNLATDEADGLLKQRGVSLGLTMRDVEDDVDFLRDKVNR